ncbi:acyl-CoA thioester hydrolase [Rhizobium halophytocola]|uniref:Acyl-CoA thioester hydrolase n=2 Tax=Rhizobium halophytocola TaxID=735519 RepID=A0ABS4DZ10_9HYPH|nr:acyl-CoA thioester hydrolase [Rhizobium halophytocola]
MTLVWQGTASQWECDHMGHLNTRFYIKRLAEGLQAFANHLGFTRHPGHQGQALRAVQIHARFLTEVHVAQPLALYMGVIACDQDGLLLQAALCDPDEPQRFAAFVLRTRAQDLESGILQPLDTAVLSKADTLSVAPDNTLQPRSFGIEPLPGETVKPDSGALRIVGAGAWMEDSVDENGLMRAEEPIARLADSMGGLMRPYRGAVIDHADPVPARPGGAMLETRIDIVRWPRVGRAFRLSGVLTGYGSKTQEIESLVVDAVDGHLVAVMRCVAIVFDLDKRRAVPVSDKAAKVLAGMIRGSALG